MDRTHTKTVEVHATACGALQAQFGPKEERRLLGLWIEPDGRVMLHLDSTETASVVAHALWRRYRADGGLHPEHGVLIWVL